MAECHGSAANSICSRTLAPTCRGRKCAGNWLKSSGLSSTLRTVALLKSAVGKNPPYLLALTDVSNTTTTARITEKSKQCGELLKGVKSTTAIVGVTETKKVIARIVSPDVRVFESPEKAKDWLAAQARSGQRS